MSRKWRNAVQSCPQLWTKISLDIENVRPPIPYLEICLERSKNLLIDLRIEEGSREDDPIPLDTLVLYLERFGVTISQHMGRLRTIFINTLSLGGFIGRFLTALPFAEAKRLKKVDITCEPAEQVGSALAKAPAFQQLRCRWWGELRPLTLFPLQRLTHLDLGLSLAWEKIAELLSLCTSVVVLHLTSRSVIYPQALLQSIPLPNLKSLTLRGPHDMYFVLPKFHCPNLRAFCLHCENDWSFEVPPRPYDPLFQFIASSNHCLQYLKLYDSNFPVALLGRLFAIPRLTTVHFFDFHSELSLGNIVPERIGDVDLLGVDFASIERDLKEVIESSSNPNVRGMTWSVRTTDPGYLKMHWATFAGVRSMFDDDPNAFDSVMYDMLD